MSRLIILITIGIIMLLLSRADAFEPNSCAYNKQFQQVKRINKSRMFTYEYCIYDGNLNCKGKFTVRKKWFDKNHTKITCPKNKLVILELKMEGESLMDEQNVERLVETNMSTAKSTKNFNVKFFSCNHCGMNMVKQELVDRLQKLRDFIKLPIFIVSGYRCKHHNTAIDGAKNSQHVLGKAADIRVVDDGNWLTGEEIAELVEESGLFETGGLGTYETFVHVDIRNKRARW